MLSYTLFKGKVYIYTSCMLCDQSIERFFCQSSEKIIISKINLYLCAKFLTKLLRMDVKNNALIDTK